MIECWIIKSSLKRDEIALIKWFKSVELRNQLMDMIRLEHTIILWQCTMDITTDAQQLGKDVFFFEKLNPSSSIAKLARI